MWNRRMTLDAGFRAEFGLYTTHSVRTGMSVDGHCPCRLRDSPVTHDQLLQLFRQSGALLDGHFRLTSGLHSAGYLQCALVLQHPVNAASLGTAIAEVVRSRGVTV